MLIVLILEVFILIMILFALLIVKRREALQVRRQQERRALTRSLPVQIICGDCMGDEHSPRRTFLGIYERCSRCGGSSYVLASALASNVRLHHLVEASWRNDETNSAQVLSMEDHLTNREDRKRQIAV